MARRVTAKWLREHLACKEQVVVFEEEWPDGVEVNAESLRRANKLGLELCWFAETWLSKRAYAKWDKATDPACDRWVAARPQTNEGQRRADRQWDKAVAEALIAQVEAGRG